MNAVIFPRDEQNKSIFDSCKFSSWSFAQLRIIDELKTQHLLSPTMKANIILLFVSSLSIFLFNNWNPALRNLGLSMSKPL